MDREELDRFGLGRSGDLHAVVVKVLGLKVGQQSGKRGVAIGLRIRGNSVEEHREVVGTASDLAGLELDIEIECPDRPASEVDQWFARMAAQPTQHVSNLTEPVPRLRRVGKIAKVFKRVGERDDLGGVGALDRPGQFRLKCEFLPIVGPTDPTQLPAAAAQQREITDTDVPPRSGEQTQHGRVRRHVVDDPQDRDNIDNFRLVEQSSEADDLERQAGPRNAATIAPFSRATRTRIAMLRAARQRRGRP